MSEKMSEKKGKNSKENQINKLKNLVGPEGVIEAQQLADTKADIVRLAARLIPAPNHQIGLSRSQRTSYFHMLAQAGGKEFAEKFRNNCLKEKGLDPKSVGPEPAQTEKKKVEAKG